MRLENRRRKRNIWKGWVGLGWVVSGGFGWVWLGWLGWVFVLNLSLGLFDMEKNNFNISEVWLNDRWKSYICIPSGAQTHMMTHTKWEPFARPIRYPN